METEHRRVNVGEVSLHVAIEGHGPPVLLLHGFPEYGLSWRYQMRALADAGFQAIAPDLRGYHRSDRPRGVAAYDIWRLADDAAGVLKALGHSKAHWVGHDWGGVVAYHAALRHPARVDHLTVINAPHPELMRREVRRGGQLLRSWYVLAFQLPWLPERVVRSERVLQHLFRGTADASERLDPAVISAYAHALREPGAATAALNYYRAALRYPRRAQGPIAKPTLVVWGEKDPALTPRLLDGLQRYVPDLRVRRLAHAGHWVHQERPREVNEALLKFLPPPQKTAAADRSARLA